MNFNKIIHFDTYFTIYYPTEYIFLEKVKPIFLHGSSTYKRVDDSKMIIVGQDIYHCYNITIDEYIKLIQKIIKMFPDKKIIYFPHNRGSKGVIKNIKLFIEICETEYLIEDYLYRQKLIPRYIIGWFLTALLVLKMQYRNLDVIAFRLPKDVIGKDKLKDLEIC